MKKGGKKERKKRRREDQRVVRSFENELGNAAELALA
jgi:hypothetical protein